MSEPLPGIAQEIADVIGRERALFLIGQLATYVAGVPGKRSTRLLMYVPRVGRLKDTHQLVRILGRPDAERLCSAFGTENLQPASCNHIVTRWNHRAIHELRAQGFRRAEIVELVGVSDRRLRQVLAAGNTTRGIEGR